MLFVLVTPLVLGFLDFISGGGLGGGSTTTAATGGVGIQQSATSGGSSRTPGGQVSGKVVENAGSDGSSWFSSSSNMVTRKIPVYNTLQGEGIMNLVCPRGGKLSSIDFASYGQPSACGGWRATKGCDPEGGRLEDGDLPCDAAVPGGRNSKAGYCECADGSRRFASKCGHAGLPHGCGVECEKVITCKGWQQTTNCDPHKGKPMGRIEPCDRIVAPHLSGYCLCSNDDGRTSFRVAHSTCDHAPFTCEDMCTSGQPRFPPMKESTECHAPSSRKVVEGHCAIGVALCAIDTSHGGYLFEGGNGGKQSSEKWCKDVDPKNRRLHVRVTCDQQVKRRERRDKSVGEICRGTTDALKKCFEHHLVAEAEKCQAQYKKVLECQRTAAELSSKAV